MNVSLDSTITAFELAELVPLSFKVTRNYANLTKKIRVSIRDDGIVFTHDELNTSVRLPSSSFMLYNFEMAVDFYMDNSALVSIYNALTLSRDDTRVCMTHYNYVSGNHKFSVDIKLSDSTNVKVNTDILYT